MDEFVTPFEGGPLSSEEYAQIAFAYIQGQFPDYVPRPSQIDTALIQANALLVQELDTLARQVSVDIFTAFASKFLGVDRQLANRATGTAEFVMVDHAGYTVPTGTQIALRMPNGERIGFETIADLVITTGNTTGSVGIVAVEPGRDGSGLSGAAEILTTIDWIASASVPTTTISGRDDETEDEYVERLLRRLRIYAPRPILPADFAELALDINGVHRALVRDLFNPNSNLLSVNQSSVETDLAGFQTGLANTTTSRQGSGGLVGNALVRSTRTSGSGAVLLKTSTGTNGIPVTPGKRYGMGIALKGSVIMNAQIGIEWFTAAGASISTSLSTAQNIETTWQEFRYAAYAPATAAFASVMVQTGSIGAASYIDGDALFLREGSANTGWTIGGTPSTGNARTVAIAAIDEAGTPIPGAVRNELVAYLEAMREVNFVVLPMEPDIRSVTVAATITVLPGFDPDQIQADVKAAVELAFSPAQFGMTNDEREWRLFTKLRMTEIAETINRVNGVDFISALTLDGGTSDLLLSGGAPLVSATATITIGTEAP